MSRFLRICNQSLQKVLLGAKQIFSLKNWMWVSKNAEFHADFESVEKVLRKCTIKKLLAKMWRKKPFFSLFTNVRQTFFAYNFFLMHFFTTFSTDSKSAWNSAFFGIFFDFLQIIFFWGHISTFCKLWSRTRKNGSKNKKTYFVNVS